MNKNDIINKISSKLNMTKKDVGLVLDDLILTITQALKEGEKVTIVNFGSFEKSITKPIDIFSPYDGKILKSVNQVRVRFKSSEHLKEELSIANK